MTGACAHIDAWLPGYGQAAGVKPADALLLTNPDADTLVWGTVSSSERRTAPSVRVFTAGARLVCPATAMIPTQVHGPVPAADLIGQFVAVRTGTAWGWQSVTAIQDVGDQPAQDIAVDGPCLWAGERRGAYILVGS